MTCNHCWKQPGSQRKPGLWLCRACFIWLKYLGLKFAAED
jgi:ribosomal protein S14